MVARGHPEGGTLRAYRHALAERQGARDRRLLRERLLRHHGHQRAYDPVANAWSTTGSLSTARSDHSATRLANGKVLSVGGRSSFANPFETSCELYDPVSGTWGTAASISQPRSHHAATLLRNGLVLVTGGYNKGGTTNTAETYNPATNTWTATGNNMSYGHFGHTSTVMSDGRVLVAGGGFRQDCGYFFCLNPVAAADLYNPVAGTFTATHPLSEGRGAPMAALLPNRRVLVAGGWTTGFSCFTGQCTEGAGITSSAEAYTPLTLKLTPKSLNLGLLEVGLTSAPGLSSIPRTVTVANVSNSPVTFASITAQGDYLLTNNCPVTPATLNSGQSCTLTVRFSPTAPGTWAGSITLVDNCPGSTHQTVPLTGTGEPGPHGVCD